MLVYFLFCATELLAGVLQRKKTIKDRKRMYHKLLDCSTKCDLWSWTPKKANKVILVPVMQKVHVTNSSPDLKTSEPISTPHAVAVGM